MPSPTEPSSHPPDLSRKLPSLGKPRSHPKKASKPSNPPVKTPILPNPPALDQIAFTRPVRRILSTADQEHFVSSLTHELVTAFTLTVADSVIDVPVSTVSQQERHKTISILLRILQETEDILQRHPADHNNGSRFGNPIFRSFVSSLVEESRSMHEGLLATLPLESKEGVLDEVTTYFNNAWGSTTRIDYGSGHELNFLIYLLCLNRLSLLPPSNFQQVALLVFPRYLHIMRKIQAEYYLEPAGSHGVWGLDDYHFLPFLFGSAQLQSHPFIRPLAIHNEAMLDDYGDDYLYLDMVRYVNSTKTVQGLRWHSPMLDDISGVKEGWSKIYQGMRRMFLHEVIGKLVVMQHFLFGGLIPAVPGMIEPGNPKNEEASHGVSNTHGRHQHGANSWSDCCGIEVPSSVGAVQESRKHGVRQLRPLPFD